MIAFATSHPFTAVAIYLAASLAFSVVAGKFIAWGTK